MAAADRLSVLPDEVLHRILSFTPAKRGASTAVLSRRWRPVWHGTGAVILDSSNLYGTARTRSCPEPFLRDATKVLDVFRRTGTELKRLTLLLDKSAYHDDCFVSREEKQKEAGRDRVDSVVCAHPSAAELEELIVRCCRREPTEYSYRYRPWLPSLQCAATLRVLELAHCQIHPPPLATGPDLPRLSDLRLHHCIISEGYLQAVVDAAPALTNLKMVYVTHKPVENLDNERRCSGLRDGFSVRLCLRFPTVTTFELEASAYKEELQPWANPGIHLDMPCLRSFRYNGFPVKLLLTSPAPALTRIDLDVSRRNHNHDARQYEPKSRMLTSFSSTRVLRLRLDCIEDILTGEEEHGGAILPTFPNLQLLEVEGHYKHMNTNTTRAMARLLGSCPAMSELRLRLNIDWRYASKTEDPLGGPFAQSIERFNRLSSMPSTHRDILLLAGVSDISDAMTNNCGALSCLEKSLRNVTLRFNDDEVDCFQVQLAKFIVENAMVLEEIHIDDGNQFFPDHLYNKVAKWRADSFRRRNLPDTVGFRVY